jgi:hypothetical protein
MGPIGCATSGWTTVSLSGPIPDFRECQAWVESASSSSIQNAPLSDQLPNLVLDSLPLREVRNIRRPMHLDPTVPA